MALANLLASVNTAALEDLTVEHSGGGTARLLPKGMAIVQFTGYIETGKHESSFQGQAPKVAPEYRLAFRVVGGQGKGESGVMEAYVQEPGKYPRIMSFGSSIYLNDKSGYKKIFNAMNYAKDASNFPQLLGKKFLLPVDQYLNKKGKLVNKYDFSKLAPALDAMTGQPYPTPDVDGDEYQLFLWDQPTQEQWDSIFIGSKGDDGEYVVDNSKNFIQNRCFEALNYVGSPLCYMLGGGDIPNLETGTTVTPENDEGVTDAELPDL